LDDDHNNSSQPSRQGIVASLRQVLSGKRRITSERELQEIIEESEETGIINEGEGEMLSSIFEFGETIVREVMVPRTDMVACSIDAPLKEVLDTVISSGHSRIPVYADTVDSVIGVVYAKDLLRYWGRPPEQIELRSLLRKAYFIPETKLIEELLNEFRHSRVHLAIVIDEYGGTSGLITIEDLLEEIVGDIQDEYDREEEWLEIQEDGSLKVDGRLNLEELEEHFEIDIPREKYDTVAGYLSHLAGHIPGVGEEFTCDGLRMKVLNGDQRRIDKVQIWRATDMPENPDSVTS